MAPEATMRVVNGARVSTMRPLPSQPMSVTPAFGPAPRPVTIREICGPVAFCSYSSMVMLPDQSSTPQRSPCGAAMKPGSVVLPQPS